MMKWVSENRAKSYFITKYEFVTSYDDINKGEFMKKQLRRYGAMKNK